MSVYHEGLLLLKSATVNKNLDFDEVCGEKHVYIAYNNEPPDIFEAVLGRIVKFDQIPNTEYIQFMKNDQIRIPNSAVWT